MRIELRSLPSLSSLGYLLLAIGYFTSGCVTTPGGQRALDVARVARIAGTAADFGAQVYLQQHPEAAPAFRLAENVLTSLIDAENWDPAAFASALRSLPVKELRSPEGALLASAAVLLWDELAAESRTLDKTQWVRPVMLSVRNGLRRALSIPSLP